MVSTFAMMMLLEAQAASVPPSPVPPPPPAVNVIPPAVPPPPIRTIYAPLPPPAPPPGPMPAAVTRAQARAGLSTLVSTDDYPASALRANEQGIVSFALDIWPNGRVSNCTVTRSSGSAALDSTTCRLMRSRARFTPARDRAGNPTADRIAARIDWRINRPWNLPFAPFLSVEEIRADAAGALTCVAGHGGAPLAAKPCSEQPVSGRLAALARAQGMPLTLSIVRKMTPQGETEPADRTDRGDNYVASDARLEIAPDGSVIRCTAGRNEWIGGGNQGVPPDPCREYYAGRKIYLKAPEETGIRSVRVTVRGYAKHQIRARSD